MRCAAYAAVGPVLVASRKKSSRHQPISLILRIGATTRTGEGRRARVAMSFQGGTTRIKQKIQIGSMGGRLDYGGDDRAFHKDDVPKRVRHHLSVKFTHRCSCDMAHPPTTDPPTHSPHLSPGSLHVGCTLLDHRFTPRQHTHSLSPPPPSPLAPPVARLCGQPHTLAPLLSIRPFSLTCSGSDPLLHSLPTPPPYFPLPARRSSTAAVSRR